MSIQPYIMTDLEMRSVNDNAQELQQLFDELNYSHIPVEKDGVYIGSISENDVRCFDEEKKIGDFQFSLEGFFVRETDNWMDVLESFSKNETNILPVLNENSKYIGIVALYDIVNIFTDTPFLLAPGGIIILEKGYKDFSFSEISQIVESNGEQVLGLFISKMENDMAQITLKIGQNSMNSILQAFRRYGYIVVSHHQEDTFKSNLKERSKYLDKYLNI